MHKFLFVLFLSAIALFSDEQVEVYAETMDTQNNIVYAEGDVVVLYQDYHLSAKRALYDRSSGELELFGNIRASQGENIKLLGEYARLNIANKERTFRPFFMLERKADVWISGSDSYAKDKEMRITSGVMSGCDPNDPLWQMEFSSSNYNSDTMWLNLYNATIYIYDIPVFYIPYFGYSLDNTRRTGLLPPMIGFSEKEGFYYEQALYIAEQNEWDLELKPQIRTNRGSGLYTTFRFLDGKTSKGTFSAGYFKEKSDYFLENKLANQKHYGFRFEYENNDVINEWFDANLEGQSGLYMDIVNMNDVDYLNLSTNNTTKTTTTRQLISRVNIFYNTEENYYAAYFKNYKDLTKETNEETIQNLPSAHYHRYIKTLLKDHFLYSIDVKSNNYYRKVGKNAVQTDINIPLMFQTSLFDEFMNISYTSNIYAQHTAFRGDEKIPSADEYSNGIYLRNSHLFSASSQLARAYKDYTHVIDIGASYQVAGVESEEGYYGEQEEYCAQSINQSDPLCEFYNITDVQKKLKLYFSHYLYDVSGKQIFYHRLGQNISYEDVNGGAGELENELDYQITENINFYNNMFFNYDESAFSKNFNKITYAAKDIQFALSHMYKDTFFPHTKTTSPITNYMTSSIDYRYDRHYSYTFKLNYDFERSLKKSFEIGFLYQKRCWDFGLAYVENTRPILNRDGFSNSIQDRFIYITIRLKPVMKNDGRRTGFMYRLPDTTETN